MRAALHRCHSGPSTRPHSQCAEVWLRGKARWHTSQSNTIEKRDLDVGLGVMQ